MVSALTPIGFVLNSKKKLKYFRGFFLFVLFFAQQLSVQLNQLNDSWKNVNKEIKPPKKNGNCKWYTCDIALLKRHPGLRSYFLNFAHMSLIDFLTEEEIAFSPNSIVPKSRLEEEKFSRAQHYCQELCYCSPFLYHQSCVLVYFFSHITVPCIHLFISQ